MAITPTLTRVNGEGNAAGWKAIWANMVNGDVGTGVVLPDYADRSIQVEGTFGAGGSVACDGNNDGTNFRALTDPQGTTIAITAAGIKAVTEATINIRPKVTAGDGTTSLTVTMFFRKTATP